MTLSSTLLYPVLGIQIFCSICLGVNQLEETREIAQKRLCGTRGQVRLGNIVSDGKASGLGAILRSYVI